RPLAQRAEYAGRNRLPLGHRRPYGKPVVSPKRKSDAGNNAAISSQLTKKKMGDRSLRIAQSLVKRSSILKLRSPIFFFDPPSSVIPPSFASFFLDLNKHAAPSKNLNRRFRNMDDNVRLTVVEQP